jgi:hypothetical protein
MDQQEEAAWLTSLRVEPLLDENREVRWFVIDFEGEHVGDAFDTADLARRFIDKLRRS